MAKVTVEVYACDRAPAHTWTITGPEGSPRQIDLCDQHCAPIANAHALALPATPPRSSTDRRRRVPHTHAIGSPAAGRTRLALDQPVSTGITTAPPAGYNKCVFRGKVLRVSVGLRNQNGAGPRPTSDINTCIASTFRTLVTATAPIRS